MVFLNGRLLPIEEAKVPVLDRGFIFGDGVYELVPVYSRVAFRLDEHLARLEHSARALAFADIPSREKIIEEIKRTLAANQMRDGVHIRLTLTRGVKVTSGMDPRLNQAGPTLIVLAEFKPPVYDKGGIRLVTTAYRRPGPDVLDPKIHHNNLINSILAKIQANAAGVDDALMLDGRGFVAETNATHVFMAEGGVLATPTTAACPEGITRSVVLELCRANAIPCFERDISLAEFYRADEAFCTGTMGELAPITEIDGRRIGTGQGGPLYVRLTELFRSLTATEGVVVCD
jgi:branched-chain amino acid aminotransferase